MTGRTPKQVIGIIIEATGDEWIAYSPETDQAHALNATAAEILDVIDGRTDIGGLCERLDLGVDVVLLGLKELHEAQLISYDADRDSKTVHQLDPASADRRALLMKLGIGSVAAAALPVVETIIAPTRAAAASLPNPTPVPTDFPTPVPTAFPTSAPTMFPTPFPTAFPTPVPTGSPTPGPTPVPTGSPTPGPTPVPTGSPTPGPTPAPTAAGCTCSGIVVAPISPHDEDFQSDIFLQVELSNCAPGTVQAVLRQNGTFRASSQITASGRAAFGLIGCNSSPFDATVEVIETGEILCSTTFDHPCCSCSGVTATVGPVVDGFANVEVSANLSDSCDESRIVAEFRRNGAVLTEVSLNGAAMVSLPCGSDPVTVNVRFFEQGIILCSTTVDIACPPPCSCSGIVHTTGPVESDGLVRVTAQANLSNCEDFPTEIRFAVHGVQISKGDGQAALSTLRDCGSGSVHISVVVIATEEVLCTAIADLPSCPALCSCSGLHAVVGPLEADGTVGITPGASLSNCADQPTQFVVSLDGVRTHTASPVSFTGIHTFFIPVESIVNVGSVTAVDIHVEIIDTGEVLCSAPIPIGA